MIRLIASDMDGTLLDENSEVPPETFLLIHQLWAEGVRFCVSSGRPLPFLRKVFRPVADEMDYVCSNGAHVVIQGKTVDREIFSYASVVSLRNFCRDFDTLHMVVSDTEGNSYLCDEDPGKVRRFLEMAEQWDDFSPIVGMPDPGVNIITAGLHTDNGEPIMDIAYILGLELGDLFTFCPTDDCSIDFMPRGVSKATGIRQVMKHYDVWPSETMAYGDSMNDYDIFRAVGHPVAMANSLYALKQVAERVIETNVEHGVQRDMQRLLDPLRAAHS